MTTTSNDIATDHPALLDDIILHEDDLSDEAKSRFGYHTDILCAFEAYRHSVLCNEHLTRVGRHLLFSALGKLHTDCKQVLNYVTENNELQSRSLPLIGPLVICGLPRTGTTLLYNLLACDPNCRAPLFTEMAAAPVPPISRSDSVGQERRAAAVKLNARERNKLIGQTSEVKTSHAIFPVEEDYNILRHAGMFVFITTIISDPKSESDTWVDDEIKKDFAYDYHETFLRMLNSVDAPSSHWLLKAFIHNLFLDTLLRHYPNVALVMTHRRLDHVFPSFCRLMRNIANRYFDERDSAGQDASVTRSIQLINKMIDYIMDFRTRRCQQLDQLQKGIFDVDYDDLMEQPITTVHRIYDYFGLKWSDEFEMGMQSWLCNNPQGKQGRHKYHLADLGLTHKDIETRYAAYTKRFLRSPSSDAPSSDQHSQTHI